MYDNVLLYYKDEEFVGYVVIDAVGEPFIVSIADTQFFQVVDAFGKYVHQGFVGDDGEEYGDDLAALAQELSDELSNEGAL